MKPLLVSIVACLIPAVAMAQDAAAPKTYEIPASKSFGGLNFGVGISLTIDTGDRSRVKTAEVVNGVVRVTEQNDTSVGLVLESHYFFVPQVPLAASVPPGQWGHGPFIAVEASNSNDGIINAYGIGWMIGLRQPSYTWNPTTTSWDRTYSSSSWNFGVGLRVDPKVQVLGDGVEANKPLPNGETSVRFKDDAQYGVMLLSSFSF